MRSGDELEVPILRAVFAACQTRGCDEWFAFPSGFWIDVFCRQSATPRQGWKLHVSADVSSAAEVLHRCLPVLLAETAEFKVASSLVVLEHLNAGTYRSSQIGKFITVYPADDAQAVRLAVALHLATRGLSGPMVPSDRPLSPGSLVHYRYAAFSGGYTQLPSGEMASTLQAPNGDTVLDRRMDTYSAPDWIVDPFQDIDLGASRPTRIQGDDSRADAPPVARATRPLTDKERARLIALTRTPGWPGAGRVILFLVGLPTLGMLLAMALITRFGQVHPPVLVLWAIIAGGALAGLLLGCHELYQAWNPERTRALRNSDLKRDSVEMLCYTVSRAAQVRLDRDSRPDYLLDIGNLQLLFLKSRHFIDADGLLAAHPVAAEVPGGEGQERLSPCRVIVERLVNGRDLIQVRFLGGQFQVSRTIDLCPDLGWSDCLRDGELIPGNLSTLGEDLLRLRAKRQTRKKRRGAV